MVKRSFANTFEPCEIALDSVNFKKDTRPLGGYCSSTKCNPKRFGDYGENMVLKTTNRSLDFCPDCKSALFWARVDKNISKNSVRRKKET